MSLADPRNIELTMGSVYGVRVQSPDGDQVYFQGKDIRTGPTMVPDLAVIVINGAINPTLDNVRPIALAIEGEDGVFDLQQSNVVFETAAFGATTSTPEGEREFWASFTTTLCPASVKDLPGGSSMICAAQNVQTGKKQLCTGEDALRQTASGDGGKEFCRAA